MNDVTLNTETLRRTQIDRGLTDAELAKEMGLTERTLHNWRSGYTRPSWNRLVAVARALGLEPAELAVQDGEIKEAIANG